jgi:hypothetical protein
MECPKHCRAAGNQPALPARASAVSDNRELQVGTESTAHPLEVQAMADMSETKPPITKGLDKRTDPDFNEIADTIENQARMLQESGLVNEAANLRDWARELRQKSVRTPY